MDNVQREVDFAIHVAKQAIEAFVKAYRDGYRGSLEEALEDLYVTYDVQNVFGPALTISLGRPAYEIGS